MSVTRTYDNGVKFIFCGDECRFYLLIIRYYINCSGINFIKRHPTKTEDFFTFINVSYIFLLLYKLVCLIIKNFLNSSTDPRLISSHFVITFWLRDQIYYYHILIVISYVAGKYIIIPWGTKLPVSSEESSLIKKGKTSSSDELSS